MVLLLCLVIDLLVLTYCLLLWCSDSVVLGMFCCINWIIVLCCLFADCLFACGILVDFNCLG